MRNVHNEVFDKNSAEIYFRRERMERDKSVSKDRGW